MMPKTTRIVLADENRLFIDSLKAVIEKRKLRIKVVNTAHNCIDAIKKTEKEQPDILLADINLPGMDRLEMIKTIRGSAPNTKIIILTANTDPSLIKESLKNEVAGYLLKDIALTELMTLLPLASDNVSIVSRELVPALCETGAQTLAAQPGGENTRSGQPVFSSREKKLLDLMIQGLSNREIAEKMCLAEQTVKNYVSAIYAKLGVRNRLQAIQKGKTF